MQAWNSGIIYFIDSSFAMISGEVMLWDLSKEDDLLLTSSGVGDDAHREPVTKVHWIPDNTTSKKDKFLVRVHSNNCFVCIML